MERYLNYLREGAEKRTDEFLHRQITDPEDPCFGALKTDILEVKPTVYACTTAVSVYVCRDSRYYHSRELYQGLDRAYAFIEKIQRPEGYLDYPSCNFLSAPDTSFCFKRLIAAWRLLVKYDDGPSGTRELAGRIRTIMHRALSGIAQGGFHTPNHRWAVSAALMQGANIFADEKDFAGMLRRCAGQYLAEGIDIDEDGEYAERSTGNYNAVVNNALLSLYEETGDAQYLDDVHRNLRMMLYYVDPDGTIFTQNSTRQDQGKQMYMDKYFYQYLFVAEKTKDPVMDAAGHKIIRDALQRGSIAPDCFHIVENHDAMWNYHFTGCGFPETYRKYFPHAEVYRVKTPSYAYTVLNGKSAFLYFRRGALALCLKIGESYCDIRNFIPEKLEISKDQNTTVLSGTKRGWYYQPFAEKPATSDWWKMDNAAREKLYNSRIDTTLIITEREDGLDLTLKTEGLDQLPMRMEFCVPAGCILESETFRLDAKAGEGLILKGGNLTVSTEDDAVSIGPGFGEHSFRGHYQGEEINTGGYTVYLNAYTPFEKTVSVRVKK